MIQENKKEIYTVEVRNGEKWVYYTNLCCSSSDKAQKVVERMVAALGPIYRLRPNEV